MNMKTVVVCATALFCSVASLADTTGPRKRPPIHRGGTATSGGLVFGVATGKHLCIVNAQQIAPRTALEEGALAVKKQLMAPVEIVDDFSQGSVEEKVRVAMANSKTAAVVAFVDDEKSDSLVFYPDRGYAVVNVKALAKDGEAQERVAERTKKDVWRAFGLVLGAGEAIGGFSVLQRASTLAELDAIKGHGPSPEQHNRMVDSMTKLGVKLIKVASYRDACQQGWAPAPTNDIQKAIWDKVHAAPQNPMKIEYDPKKGR